MTKLIERNTTIPTKATQVFSTADDNQTAVTVHVLQGERESAAHNKSLGRFDLADIPPAPRGMPQIEVTFDIDANGILNVSAKDKATGKQQSIVIKASSGLSDDEIEKMVKDAESHRDEDKKFQELVAARNQADNLIHATEKSLKENGDKISAEEKSELEQAVNDVREALKSDDKAALEAKTQALGEISGKVAEKLYSQEAAGAGKAGADSAQAQGGPGASKDEDVVDAEFEEVKENKK